MSPSTSNDPPPCGKRRLHPMSACNVSTVTGREKCSIIANRPHTFQRAIDEVHTLPLTPQRVAQKANLSFLKNKISYKSFTAAQFSNY